MKEKVKNGPVVNRKYVKIMTVGRVRVRGVGSRFIIQILVNVYAEAVRFNFLEKSVIPRKRHASSRTACLLYIAVRFASMLLAQ